MRRGNVAEGHLDVAVTVMRDGAELLGLSRPLPISSVLVKVVADFLVKGGAVGRGHAEDGSAEDLRGKGEGMEKGAMQKDRDVLAEAGGPSSFASVSGRSATTAADIATRTRPPCGRGTAGQRPDYGPDATDRRAVEAGVQDKGGSGRRRSEGEVASGGTDIDASDGPASGSDESLEGIITMLATALSCSDKGRARTEDRARRFRTLKIWATG